MKTIILFLIPICSWINIYSQNKKLDSLLVVYKNANHDSTRCRLILAIGYQYEKQTPDTALQWYNKAYSISTLSGNKTEQFELYAASALLFSSAVECNYKGNYQNALMYSDKSLKLFEKLSRINKDKSFSLKAKQGISDCFNNIGIVNLYQSNYDKAMEYFLKALKLNEETGNKQVLSSNYSNIGNIHYYKGDYDLAKENYLFSLKIQETIITSKTDPKKIIEAKKGMSKCYNNIGRIYTDQGNYDKAIEYILKSLKIKEDLFSLGEVEGKKGISACYTNLGNIHCDQGSYEKANEYYQKSLTIDTELGDKKGISLCITNIGNIHFFLSGLASDITIRTDHYKQAIEYYLKALKISDEIGDKKGISKSYNNIGNVYQAQGSTSSNRKNMANNHDKAIEFYLKAIKIKNELSDKNGLCIVNGNIAEMHLVMADSTTGSEANRHLNSALDFGLSAYNSAKDIMSLPQENIAAGILMKANTKLGNYKKAIEYADIYIATKDSMFKDEKTKSIANAEKKFEAEKKQLQIEKLNKEKELQQSELLRQLETGRRQKLIIGFVIFGLLITVLFAVFIVQRLRITRKQKRIIEEQKNIVDEKNTILNQQNEEIRSQRDEIESQRDEISAQRDLVVIQKDHIEEQKQEITDSINYAKRIQHAVLPSGEFAEKILGEHFILFKPKDIVSGDFYWATQINEYLIITVSDCTGHGVPGAFMSMLGVSFLNEIVRKKEVTKASEVLDNLRDSIIEALQQKGTSGEQKDGMDIALCVLNKETNLLQFSGANNPLYIIKQFENVKMSQPALVADRFENQLEERSNQLVEVKGDKQPVAIHERMSPFTNHEIQLNKGDCIYLTSDGFADQFGGPKNKQFRPNQLKELLVNISDKTMSEQLTILNNTFENWKGDFEQIDDVTILGFKL